MAKTTKSSKSNGGRPTILTKEMAEVIIDLLKRGNYLSTASSYVGISPATITSWAKKGNALAQEQDERDLDETEQMFVWFAVEVEKARAWAEIKSVEIIRQAGNETWQAAAWFLERTNPREWGRVSRTEITGADGGAIEIDASSVNRKIEAMLANNIIDAEVVEDEQDELSAPLSDTEQLKAEIKALANKPKA